MRRLLLVASFAIVMLPACGSGGSSSSSGSAPEDTCSFIADPNNCYRKLVAAVDDCLTDVGDGGASSTGALSSDGLSCTYPTGRTVTFGSDARQYGSQTPMDVTVTVGGKTCVRYVTQPKTSMTITGPDGGTINVTITGTGETITCPDGSAHGIDAQKLFGGCGDAGGLLSGALPGTATSSGGKTVSGSLLGQKKQAYSCTTQ